MEYALLFAMLFFAALLTVSPSGSAVRNQFNSNGLLIVLVVMAVADVATADVGVSDRLVYLRDSEVAAVLTLSDAYLALDYEPLFVLVTWIGGRLGRGEWGLFAFIGLVSAVGQVFALRLVFRPWESFIVWLTLVATGLFRSYAAIAARQGLAVTMIMAAICWFASREDDAKPFYGLLAAACLFHWSAIVPASGLAALKVFRLRLKTIVITWCLALLLFLTGLNQALFGRLGEQLALIDLYTTPDVLRAYGGGVNRLDFMFTIIALALIAAVAAKLCPDDTVQQRLSACYFMLSSYFLLFGFVAFSDRLASYAWFMAPILAWYPIFRSGKQFPAFFQPAAVTIIAGLGFMTGGLANLAAA